MLINKTTYSFQELILEVVALMYDASLFGLLKRQQAVAARHVIFNIF